MKGLAMKNRRLLAAATVGLAFAVAPAAALASDGGITVQDRCDPDSFADAQIECVRPAGDGGGAVTFNELISSLIANRANDKWRFKEEKVTLRAGQPLKVTMDRGGEFHTITPVAQFGHGCVPPLNALVFPGENAEDVPAVCATTLVPHLFDPTGVGTGILPGQSFAYPGMPKGAVQRFQCMIHPWMKTTVTVR
jgi:hypothetical protein